MNPLDDKPAVFIASVSDLKDLQDKAQEDQEDIDGEVNDEMIQSSLANHIQSIFIVNKEARLTSGIEEKLFQSLRAYNGRYDPEDLARIKESGGSKIYMNLTPTKCRAAMSWMRDILLPASETAWCLEPTQIPDLPEEVTKSIQDSIDQISKELQQKGDGSLANAAAGMQEINQLKVDVEEAVYDQIYKLAQNEVKKYERTIADQLDNGEWNIALSDFIEDFCIFQASIMKGPIITKKKTLSWSGGKPVVKDDYCYMNRRVSPLDIYPSPSATKIDEGDLCEHIRLSRKELYSLIGIDGYSEDNIRELLELDESGFLHSWMDNYVEEEKAVEEYRGDTYRANKGVYHGIHFFGTASFSLLSDWGIPEDSLGDDEDKEFDIEAILVGDKVIKCTINDDPLLRRPYYKACFQNIPGSFWGRSLPELMRDIQRMCNATARALSNNMGIAAGPQIEVYVDRLAADEELESIYPLKMWQVTTDPTGAGGRAVQFWQPSSNANELLAVYKEFEARADDATGIPRYAYGNNQSAGAAQALANYERVVTPHGSKYISSLCIGDYVSTTYGTRSRVTGVYPQGLCDIFRVNFSNGEYVDCDMNHRWSVRSHHDRKFVTLTTEEILDKGLFRKTQQDKKNPKGFRPKWMIPQISPVEYFSQPLEIDPYTFGAILGDGDNRARLTSMDQEIFHRIPYPLGKIDKKKNNKAWSQTILGIKATLKKYLHGSVAHNKFIPEVFLKNSISSRKELLKGMMDTDGCISKRGDCFYFTVSKQLSKDFKWLVKSLGGSVKSVQVRKDPRSNRRVGYRIHFYTNFNPTHLSRKSKLWKERKRIHTYISGIEYIGKKEATCIEVSSKDHCFLVDNFIPTHNTASGLSMLLESASKGIKDAIRHIDEGLIIPRVTYQFYWNMITDPDSTFTGDINVIAKGSQALTMKGAQEMRRNEFLNILQNQTYLQIVGVEGVAEILREMTKALNLGTDIIPSRIELKRKMKQQEAQQQQAQQGEQQNKQAQIATGVQQVQLQVSQADQANQRNAQIKLQELQQRRETDSAKLQLQAQALEQKDREMESKSATMLNKQQMINAQEDRTTNKNIALDVHSKFIDNQAENRLHSMRESG